MTHKKMIYGGAAVFLLGLIIWAIVTVPETPSPDAPSGPRIMSYENNTIHEERDGRTVWTLTAKRVNVDIDTNDTTMQGIEGTFYSADGRTLALQADEGHMDSATRNIVLTGTFCGFQVIQSRRPRATEPACAPRNSSGHRQRACSLPRGMPRLRATTFAQRATASRAPMNSRGLRLQETHV